VAKAPYSSAVNTGATNIGFHASSRHSPNSARFRALCVHAPSSCQTTPTVVRQGGSAVGKLNRSAAPSSRMAIKPAANVRALREEAVIDVEQSDEVHPGSVRRLVRSQ
jgi:hypothetical protein